MRSIMTNTEGTNPEVYLSLGLITSCKKSPGFPRILSLISSILETTVENTENKLDSLEITDTASVFTGMRAPTLSIRRYMERIFKYASVIVAAKFIDDAFCSNAYYARVGGINTLEMNTLELNFLANLDFKLHVTVGTFDKYCSRIETEAKTYRIEPPIKTCAVDEWTNIEDPKHPAVVRRYSWVRITNL
ncbi:cyclin-P3-1-like isoform X5 [Zingiber officinale]|uniref:cyclin-P3-1-like isoform X5 n=1 Tax=Zingiber officinale TaxID=94328 RepID=UPI001C4C56F1|nr:cyclin-P3-1-like isoform X5 [Zingiber officinale]